MNSFEKYRTKAREELDSMKTFDEHADICSPCVQGGPRTIREKSVCIPCEEPCFWHWYFKYWNTNFNYSIKKDRIAYEKWLKRRHKEWK